MLKARVSAGAALALLVVACAGESSEEGRAPPDQEPGASVPAPATPAQGSPPVPAPSSGGSPAEPAKPVASADSGAPSPAKPSASVAPVASPEPARNLDRDASFDWPQTKPSDKRRCQGGKYVGMWTCNTFGIFPFEGKVNLQFVESMDGEFLELSDARLSGLVGEGEFRFDAKLTGRLDCTTLKFSAMVSMGSYDRLEFDGSYVPVGMFDGKLTGALEPEAGQIKGEWSLLADVLADCVGPWSASYTP